MKHPFESPPRRSVRDLYRRLVQVLSLYDAAKVSGTAFTAHRSLADALLSFHQPYPSVRLEINQLLRSREAMDEALEQIGLASELLRATHIEPAISPPEARLPAIDKLQAEAEAFRGTLSQLGPVHSNVHQATVLVAIPPAEYRKMSPAARKRRDVFNDRLVGARELIFEELTLANLEDFVKTVAEIAADAQYRSYVSSHQLKETDQELDELLNEIVVASLVLFVTE